MLLANGLRSRPFCRLLCNSFFPAKSFGTIVVPSLGHKFVRESPLPPSNSEIDSPCVPVEQKVEPPLFQKISKKWNELPLATSLQDKLILSGFHEPTDIQQIVLSRIIRDIESNHIGNTETISSLPAKPGDAIFISQTGTGKTLTYLLAILQQLLSEETPSSQVRAPFAIIMVPNPDLVYQVNQMLKSILFSDSQNQSVSSLHKTIEIHTLTSNDKSTFRDYMRSLKIKSYIDEKLDKAQQSGVEKKISEALKLTQARGSDDKLILPSPKYPPILIINPNVLLDNFDAKDDLPLLWKNLRFIVLDEADLLLSGNGEALTMTMKKLVNRREDAYKNGLIPYSKMRFIFSAATFPKNNSTALAYFVDKVLRGIPQLISASKHSLLPSLHQVFIHVDENVEPIPSRYLVPLPVDGLSLSTEELQSFANERDEAEKEYANRIWKAKCDALINYITELQMKLELSKSADDRQYKVLVFVSKVERADELYQYLNSLYNSPVTVPVTKSSELHRSNGASLLDDDIKTVQDSSLESVKVDIYCLHKRIESELRKETISKYSNTYAKNGNDKPEVGKSLSVLICTDYLSRGLDFHNIQVVLQFDFAKSAVDFLHRMGRTARIGHSGLAVNFICKEDLRLASVIEQKQYDSLEDCFSHNRALARKSKRAAAAAS